MANTDPWAAFPVAGPATSRAPTADDPWAAFPAVAPAAAPSSAFGDIVKSGGSGVVRGAAETAMLPVTIPRVLGDVADATVGRAVRFVGDPTENLVRSVFGYPELTPEEFDARHAASRKIENEHNVLNRAQDAVRGAMDDSLHKPETTAGKYANTIGEFAVPGGLFGKGGKFARAVGDVLVPALASETAGQATDGTELEPWARLFGAVAGNFGTGAARAHASAPEVAVRNAVGDVSPIQWGNGKNLQTNKFGVDLSGPEAIQQVTQGGTKLADLLRVVEGSTKGGAVTSPFFAKRPGQVNAALGDALDTIAPVSPAPSTLGPRASEAAQGALDDVRRAINADTRPLYEAAAPQTITPNVEVATPRVSSILDEYGNPVVTLDIKSVPTPVSTDPRFTEGVKRLRSNAEVGPDYATLPDNSVGVVDAVTKDLNSRGEALSTRANPLYGPEQGMRNTAAAADVRGTARAASPEYDKALETQAARRAAELQPLEAGPVGRIAATEDTRTAADALLPKNPLTGSEKEASGAVASLTGQDPGIAPALVRQNLADTADAQARKLIGGENQYAGARFAKEVAGSPQQEKNLNAVLSSLPDDTASAIFPELLDVLRATGQRKPIGSQTAFNAEMMKELGSGSVVSQASDVAKTGGMSWMGKVNDRAKALWLGKNVESLAELFTSPDSVERIQQMLQSGMLTPYRDAAVRSVVAAPQQARSE